MKKLAVLLVILCLVAVAAYAANTTPAGSNGDIQFNNNGQYGPYKLGQGLAVTTSGGNKFLNATATGSGGTPAGVFPQLQYTTGAAFAALQTDTLASYAAHDTVSNGLAYDPRNNVANPGNPAICQAPNTFTGDGHTQTFNYTIPFVGTSTTDNTNFYVYYNPSGGGAATILTTSGFSVTGVNSGIGGTVTFNVAPPNGSAIFILHDDTPGFHGALVASAASGGYVSVPDNCWIQNLVAVNGGNMIGQGFSPNYAFNTNFQKPIMHIINPAGTPPNVGINVDGVSSAFFEGFQITGTYGATPLCIGAYGTGGAGGGQLPGIVVQYMNINQCIVGFGSQIGASEIYIFATSRFNNYSGNYNGTYGPLSDFQSINDDFTSQNGSSQYAGLYLGPQQGAPGSAGAARIIGDRMEFNGNGMICDGCGLVNMEGNQFDGNAECGLLLKNIYGEINVTGGWFRGNANGGFSLYSGNSTAGQDAHVCLAGTSANAGGVNFSNVNFYTNAGENGGVIPIGTTHATTPVYVLDISTTGADNNNIAFNGGDMWFSNTTTNNNASVWDTAIYRNGRPANISFNVAGQAVQGKIANGQNPSQARGLPANKWSAYYVPGDPTSTNNQNSPITASYAGIVGKNIGVGPTFFVLNDFSHFDCDIVQNEIIPNINPNVQDNAVVTWLPSASDPSFGAGFFSNHLADTNTCRLGALTWMALPKKSKIYAQAGCTPTGTWSNSASYTGYYGLKSSTNGDSLACPITTHGGPVYLWYQMDTTSGGTFQYQLDSTTTGSVTVKGNNALGTGIQSLGAVRIPVSTPGSHTINVSLTSTTTASNTVTIEGLGTSSGLAWHGSSPAVFLGGQVNSNNGSQPTAVAAFNQAEKDQAAQLFGDGLSVIFADVQSYINNATDYFPNLKLNASGQGHVADAFSSVMQYAPVDGGVANPLNYGAACNTQLFTDVYLDGGHAAHRVTTTSGSNVISVENYVFQPGTATQNGGGDVGKVISINCRAFDVGPTTYIASVAADGSSATIGYNAAASCSPSGENAYAVMGGYPSNPNDPSTAHDDSAAILLASQAATGLAAPLSNNQTALNGGGKVWMPDNCLIHNLKPSNNVTIEGNNAGGIYTSGDSPNDPGSASTHVFVGTTGFAEDNMFGFDLTSTTHIKLKDLVISTPDFPAFFGGTTACIGTLAPSGDLDTEDILLDHVNTYNCPVGFGVPFGLNQPVTFTASIVPDIDGIHGDMTVLAITSTTFTQAYNFYSDWLALGRTVSGVGVTPGTTITQAAPQGFTGVYQVSLSQTVTSETMTSPSVTTVIAGASRFSEMDADTIGFNGDFSDWSSTGDVFTGDFVAGWYMGPNRSGSGNGSSRILGGRFEENGGPLQNAFTCDGCTNTQLTGVQFQYNMGPAISLVNSTNEFLVTGGMLQGNGASGASAQDKAQVQLGGSWQNVTFDGVEFFEAHSGGGPTSNYLLETITGSTGDYLNIQGGLAREGFATAPFSFVGNTPTHYKFEVPGLSVIDTTQTALGITASGSITAGSNTLLSLGNGAAAAYANFATTSAGNTAVGFNALKAATTTIDSTALGFNSLVAATTGTDNTAFGYNTLKGVTVGSFNTALGSGSGNKITTGSNNLVLGPNVASTTLTTGSNNILVGTTSAIDALGASTSNYVNLGGIYQGDTNVKSVWMGAGSLTTTATDGFVEISGSAGVPAGVPTAHSGYTALNYDTADNVLYAYSSGWKSAISGFSLGNTTSNATFYLGITTTTSGSATTLFGNSGINVNPSTGLLTTSTAFNATGAKGGYQIGGTFVLSNGNNVQDLCVGAASCTTTGAVTYSFNTGIGAGALSSMGTVAGGNSNTALGTNSLFAEQAGTQNTAFGANALQASNTGSNNTAMGYQAGFAVSTGASNLILGPSVGSATLTIGNNNILIGTSSAVDVTTSATSNFLNIGNLYEGDTSVKHITFGGALPAITSGSGDFGVAPLHTGNDYVGRITIGSSPGGSGIVTFSSPWTNAPDTCSCNNNTSTARPCGALSITTTSFVLSATTSPFTGADQIGYVCDSHRL